MQQDPESEKKAQIAKKPYQLVRIGGRIFFWGEGRRVKFKKKRAHTSLM